MGVPVKASHAIINATKANNKIAATAENIRRMPIHRTAEWLMNEKQMLGDLRMFSAQHTSYRAPNPESDWHWQLDLTLGGGGIVMDSGAHYYDTLRYFFGDPSTVYASVCQFEDLRVTKAGEIVKNEQAELDAEVGLRAKSICEAIYESNACGQAVEYEEVVAGNIEVYPKPINERWSL